MNHIDALAVSAIFMLCGCGQENSETTVGTALQAQINFNSLNGKALDGRGLELAALRGDALSPEASAAIQDRGQVGTLARQFLSYTVSCALDASQSLAFSWVDAEGEAHDETYAGAMGLAPAWSEGPLDQTGQRWVSACLASRVNWYGVPVSLSSRGACDALDDPSAAEQVAYRSLEGAFWGNVFGPSPALYACADAEDARHSRASKRDCAAGHIDEDGHVESCPNVTIVGACSQVCGSLDNGLYYRSCSSHPSSRSSTTGDVVTVFLR